MASTYGANITTRQFIAICISTCVGTVIEWYDFTVFAQLSSILTVLFFPILSVTPAELSCWAIYGVGFLSRPVGALLFGWLMRRASTRIHLSLTLSAYCLRVADAYGRRPALVASAVITMLATMGMGCLPTYQQAGMAAPIVLTMLRLLQGIAVGGQFGAATACMFEVASDGKRGFAASLVQQAAAPGIALGMLASVGVSTVCTTDELMLWGWRVPFLLAAVATPVAIWLRFEVQEAHEYLISKRKLLLHRIAAAAAAMTARKCARRQAKIGLEVSANAIVAQLHSVTEIVLSPAMSRTQSISDIECAEGQQLAVHDGVGSSRIVSQGGAIPAAAAAASAAAAAAGPVAEAVEDDLQTEWRCQEQQQQQQQQRGLTGGTAAAAAVGQPDLQFCRVLTQRLEQYKMRYQPPDNLERSNLRQQRHDRQYSLPGQHHNRQYNMPSQQCLKLLVNESHAVQSLGCETDYIAHMELLGEKIRQPSVVGVLLGRDWQRLLLQVFLEGSFSATFYIFLSWLPTYLRTTTTTLSNQFVTWAVIAGLGLFTIIAPYAGWIADKGIPKVWTLMGLALGASAVSIPVMFVLQSGVPVVVIVMVAIMMGMSGAMGGLLAGIGAQMYPAGVRASGVGLGHNLSMVLWGGATPFILRGIEMLVQPSALAAGVLLVVVGILSWAAGLVLLSIIPRLNSSGTKEINS